MVAELQPLLEASLAESTTHLLESTVRETMQQELTQLKNRIVREGEVDPASIEQCEQESARLDNLTKQRTDLDQAAQTLRRTITKLTEVSQARFVSTFNAVNRNFSELVPKLFGGGSARLELLDPSKPLESGIDIIARPPGKKLKSVELMSGGEKALSAICLVFAMFLERPSPLCVLDEVDAPLDEANVVRFLSMIKEMSTRIQFLMITHNKQSMTICDKLVGVTMSEPGASTVISVSLQEAYSQVA
jgi:chromosome segregation protein